MSASLKPRCVSTTAWLRTEGGVAIICGWCPDKDVADARALRAGLELNHTICPECDARLRKAAGLPPPAPTEPESAHLTVAEVNLICGVHDWATPAVFALLHWRQGDHFTGYGAGLRVRRAAVYDLYGYFATSGQPAAAKRLSLWLARADENSFPAAQQGATAGNKASDLESSRTSALPAPRVDDEPWFRRGAFA